MGSFIEISIAPEKLTPSESAAIVKACPVDIFTERQQDGLNVITDRVDECILCARCIEIGKDAVKVRRSYGQRLPLTLP